jgi:hypothetical protein
LLKVQPLPNRAGPGSYGGDIPCLADSLAGLARQAMFRSHGAGGRQGQDEREQHRHGGGSCWGSGAGAPCYQAESPRAGLSSHAFTSEQPPSFNGRHALVGEFVAN